MEVIKKVIKLDILLVKPFFAIRGVQVFRLRADNKEELRHR